jgi:hypothetical protein
MADRLSLYNEALRLIGERELANLSEQREPKRVLDTVWDDALLYLLEQGFWNFATRTSQIDSSPDVETSFGYQFAFDKPEDWIRTVSLSADQYFSFPLETYIDETGYWFSNIDPIYVRYISDDEEYGLNIAGWPMTFAKTVAAYLAFEICERLTQNRSNRTDLYQIYKARLKDARSKDAMNDPNKYLPPGSWTRSRMIGYTRSSRWDR